jgi:hypothetical protein
MNFRNTENVYQSLLMKTVISFRNAEHQFRGDKLPVNISLHVLAVKTSDFIVRETVGLLNSRKHAELRLVRVCRHTDCSTWASGASGQRTE